MRRPIARDIKQRKLNASAQVAGWSSGYPNFNPLALQPYLWLDASDTSTITSSSGSVSQWNDKSGNGRNFTQGTGTAQPTTGTTTQNSLNVIVFDGNSDFMRLTATIPVSRFFTFAYVATPSTGVDDYHLSLINTASGQQWSLITKYSSRSYEFYQNAFGSARFTLGSSTATGYNTNIVIHSAATVTSLVNGAPSNGSSSGDTSDRTFGDIFIGSATSTSNFAGVNFAEILLFDRALSGRSLIALSDYLRQKWATP